MPDSLVPDEFHEYEPPVELLVQEDDEFFPVEPLKEDLQALRDAIPIPEHVEGTSYCAHCAFEADILRLTELLALHPYSEQLRRRILELRQQLLEREIALLLAAQGHDAPELEVLYQTLKDCTDELQKVQVIDPQQWREEIRESIQSLRKAMDHDFNPNSVRTQLLAHKAAHEEAEREIAAASAEDIIIETDDVVEAASVAEIAMAVVEVVAEVVEREPEVIELTNDDVAVDTLDEKANDEVAIDVHEDDSRWNEAGQIDFGAWLELLTQEVSELQVEWREHESALLDHTENLALLPLEHDLTSDIARVIREAEAELALDPPSLELGALTLEEQRCPVIELRSQLDEGAIAITKIVSDQVRSAAQLRRNAQALFENRREQCNEIVTAFAHPETREQPDARKMPSRANNVAYRMPPRKQAPSRQVREAPKMQTQPVAQPAPRQMREAPKVQAKPIEQAPEPRVIAQPVAETPRVVVAEPRYVTQPQAPVPPTIPSLGGRVEPTQTQSALAPKTQVVEEVAEAKPEKVATVIDIEQPKPVTQSIALHRTKPEVHQPREVTSGPEVAKSDVASLGEVETICEKCGVGGTGCGTGKCPITRATNEIQKNSQEWAAKQATQGTEATMEVGIDAPSL